MTKGDAGRVFVSDPVCNFGVRTPEEGDYLLGLLHGETEGLDCSELEAKELVLRLLSGLLSEHTLSMDTLVLVHASHTHSALHLAKVQDGKV